MGVRLPRVKPEHAPFRLTEGTVRIGGNAYGPAAEIPDRDGSVWTLLRAMDGSRDIEALLRAVRAEHSGVTATEVEAAVNALHAAGYVEDATTAARTTLDPRARQRYSRSQRFYNWIDTTPRTNRWYVQEQLAKSTVTVLGVGGSGSVAATALVASGVGHFHCVDHDTVELSNLNRQVLYTEADIGRPKADAAADALAARNSDIAVTTEHARVDSVDALAALAARTDVLVMAADQPAHLRALTNLACLRTATPWVLTGYHGPDVRVMAFRPSAGPCLSCLTAGRNLPPAEQDDRPRRGHATVAMAAGLAGNYAAHLAIALLTGVPADVVGVEYGFSLVDPAATFAVPGRWRPDCPDCGQGTGADGTPPR